MYFLGKPLPREPRAPLSLHGERPRFGISTGEARLAKERRVTGRLGPSRKGTVFRSTREQCKSLILERIMARVTYKFKYSDEPTEGAQIVGRALARLRPFHHQ